MNDEKYFDVSKVVVILLSMALTTSPLEAEERAPTFFQELNGGRPQTVVFYGTSLTHSGYWTRAVKEWLDTKYPGLVTSVNSGGPGQNSDWGVKHLTEKVLAHNPGLVFIEFSYNDAHTKFRMPVEQAYQNLDGIVSGIREKKPDCIVILQIMNPPWDAPAKPSATDRPELEKFNDNYRRYAGEKQLLLIDHYPSWKNLEKGDPETFKKYIPDGSHPTAEAGLAIVWPEIQRWMEDQSGKVKQLGP